MSDTPSLKGYLHIEGYDNFMRDAFDKRKIRKGMRKVGQVVGRRAQLNFILARGEDGYPINRTGITLESIKPKVSRAGFLVKIAPRKTTDMKEFYPAYLNYGVHKGPRVRGLDQPVGQGNRRRGRVRRARGARADLIAARRNSGWRITPRANYMIDALEDEQSTVQAILSKAFAESLL